MEKSDKRKVNKQWIKALAVFSFALILLFATFYGGYEAGQSGRSIGIGPKDVTNTEVGKPSELDFSLFWEAWNKLKSESVADPDTQKMIYGSISGLLSSVDDPYTVFFSPEDNKRFLEDIGGEFDGIGVELISKSGMPTVVAPLPDTPAAAAGIKAGDIILEVDGLKTQELVFNEIIDKIRGENGTKVKLKVSRIGVEEPISFEIKRQTITVKSVEWEEKIFDGKKIFYVKVRQFGDDTDKLFADFVDKAVTTKPDGIVLDLRNDPGGYLETAIDLSSYFIDGGTVVMEQGRSGNTKEYQVTKKARLKSFSTAVLVNEGSASASEIMAGALQDRKIGKVIGVKTFGKGSVQELISLSDGSAVKITTAKWLTPLGHAIDGEGLTPDIEVKALDSSSFDVQLNRALEYIANGN